MNTKGMLIKSVLSVLFLCFYLTDHAVLDSVERQIVYHDDEPMVPGDVDVNVNVNTAEPLSHIEKYYISFNIDSQVFSDHFEKMNFRLRLVFVCCFPMVVVLMIMMQCLFVSENQCQVDSIC